MRGWWNPAVLPMPSARCPPAGESLGVCHDSRREDPGSSWQLPLGCSQKRCPDGATQMLFPDTTTSCLIAAHFRAHQAAWPKIHMLAKAGISTKGILVPCLLHVTGTLIVLVIQQAALLVVLSVSYTGATRMEQGTGLSSCHLLQQQPCTISPPQQKRSLFCGLLVGSPPGQPYGSSTFGRVTARGQTEVVPQTG